jgi:hypothetical protein
MGEAGVPGVSHEVDSKEEVVDRATELCDDDLLGSKKPLVTTQPVSSVRVEQRRVRSAELDVDRERDAASQKTISAVGMMMAGGR